jgi:hypothetical protein
MKMRRRRKIKAWSNLSFCKPLLLMNPPRWKYTYLRLQTPTHTVIVPKAQLQRAGAGWGQVMLALKFEPWRPNARSNPALPAQEQR